MLLLLYRNNICAKQLSGLQWWLFLYWYGRQGWKLQLLWITCLCSQPAVTPSPSFLIALWNRYPVLLQVHLRFSVCHFSVLFCLPFMETQTFTKRNGLSLLWFMCVSGFGWQHEHTFGGKWHCFTYLVLSGSIAVCYNLPRRTIITQSLNTSLHLKTSIGN